MFRTVEFLNAFRSALEQKGYLYLESMNKTGGWGELFYVWNRDYKVTEVAKVYKESLGRITEKTYMSDAQKLMKINHENVVKFIDKGIIEFKDEKYFFLILEHIKGKDFDTIDSKIFFEIPYHERLNYLVQALDGINEFRKDFELHRDLHPGNIMLTDKDQYKVRKIKIIDPGSSRYYYEPEDEDVDLYFVKENILNLFLQPEEIKQINKSKELKILKFPELNEFIKNLYIEEEKRFEIERGGVEEVNENFDIILEQLDDIKENFYEEIHSIDSNRKHIIFSFTTVPIRLDPDSFNFKDGKTVNVIKNIGNNLNFKNPYGGMYDIDEFLRDFTYQGDHYQAEFIRNTDMIFNYGRTYIYKNGTIFTIIAINAITINELRRSLFLIGLNEKSLNSLWISPDVLGYLIIIWLKLIRTIYLKLEFQGILKLILDIYSGGDISIAGKQGILFNNNINPKSEAEMKISQLKDNAEILKAFQSIIKELLRYFNIDIDEFEKGYRLFYDIIERYFKAVFKNKE